MTWERKVVYSIKSFENWPIDLFNYFVESLVIKFFGFDSSYDFVEICFEDREHLKYF